DGDEQGDELLGLLLVRDDEDADDQREDAGEQVQQEGLLFAGEEGSYALKDATDNEEPTPDEDDEVSDDVGRDQRDEAGQRQQHADGEQDDPQAAGLRGGGGGVVEFHEADPGSEDVGYSSKVRREGYDVVVTMATVAAPPGR